MVSLFKYIWLDSFLIYNRLYYSIKNYDLEYFAIEKLLHTQTCIKEVPTILIFDAISTGFKYLGLS